MWEAHVIMKFSCGTHLLYSGHGVSSLPTRIYEKYLKYKTCPKIIKQYNSCSTVLHSSTVLLFNHWVFMIFSHFRASPPTSPWMATCWCTGGCQPFRSPTRPACAWLSPASHKSSCTPPHWQGHRAGDSPCTVGHLVSQMKTHIHWTPSSSWMGGARWELSLCKAVLGYGACNFSFHFYSSPEWSCHAHEQKWDKFGTRLRW